MAQGTLDSKVALVTGGGTGIGRAAARQLADAGARVLIAFLSSPASSFVTGAQYPVGGGIEA